MPEIAAGEMVADCGGLQGMIEVEQPVGDIDPMYHQVGQEPASEIPEAAPVPEPEFIEWLVVALPRKSFQATWPGLTLAGPSLKPGRAAAVPAQVDLENLADPPRLQQLTCFLDVWHAALLHTDLDDLLVPVLGVDDQVPSQ